MARKRGSRFRKGADEQQQLEDIEEAQQAARQKKIRKVIASIKKSEQRLQNRFDKLKRRRDVKEQFEN